MNRRDFINNGAMTIAGIALAGTTAPLNKNTPHLSFTTLGTPDWNLLKVVDFAAKNGYDGIALRGIMRELDLTRVPDFGADKINTTIKIVKDSGLKIVELGSSAHLHDADTEKRKSNLDEAKKFIDLAEKLNCPFIRVFPDVVPEGQERDKTIDLIISGLVDLVNYAKGTQISILLEPNGDFAKTADLHYILKTAASPQVGMLWNISYMWLSTKESPAFVYESLRKYIKHTHIKDLKLVNGDVKGSASYDVLLGEGNVPVEAAVEALHKGNYGGSYCCEWEKFWYPDIREPEIALTHFSKEIRKYFKGIAG